MWLSWSTRNAICNIKTKRWENFICNSQSHRGICSCNHITFSPWAYKPGTCILDSNPLKYILYHPHFLTFTFCRIWINNAIKTEKVKKKKTIYLFFTQKMLLSTFPFLSLPSSFQLSSPNLNIMVTMLCALAQPIIPF